MSTSSTLSQTPLQPQQPHNNVSSRKNNEATSSTNKNHHANVASAADAVSSDATLERELEQVTAGVTAGAPANAHRPPVLKTGNVAVPKPATVGHEQQAVNVDVTGGKHADGQTGEGNGNEDDGEKNSDVAEETTTTSVTPKVSVCLLCSKCNSVKLTNTDTYLIACSLVQPYHGAARLAFGQNAEPAGSLNGQITSSTPATTTTTGTTPNAGGSEDEEEDSDEDSEETNDGEDGDDGASGTEEGQTAHGEEGEDEAGDDDDADDDAKETPPDSLAMKKKRNHHNGHKPSKPHIAKLKVSKQLPLKSRSV